MLVFSILLFGAMNWIVGYLAGYGTANRKASKREELKESQKPNPLNATAYSGKTWEEIASLQEHVKPEYDLTSMADMIRYREANSHHTDQWTDEEVQAYRAFWVEQTGFPLPNRSSDAR